MVPMITKIVKTTVADMNTNIALEAHRTTVNDIIRDCPIVLGRAILNQTIPQGGAVVKINHLLQRKMAGFLITGLRDLAAPAPPAAAAGVIIQVTTTGWDPQTQLWLKSVGFGVNMIIDLWVF